MSSSESACEEVSTVLWRERELLEGLAFSLQAQSLMLDAGDDRWLPRACREVAHALSRLRYAELVRAVQVDVLAGLLMLAPCPTLRRLAAIAPEPWGEIFSQHRCAFLDLTGEVIRLADRNRGRLGSRRDATEEGPGWLRPPGASPADPVLHSLLDGGTSP